VNVEQDPPRHEPKGFVSEVWFAGLGRHLSAVEDEERRCPRLSPDEVVRAERIDDPDRRRLWRASHIALRECLERICGPAIRRVPFVSKAGGRPELAPELQEAAEISFSLSHTTDVALIGISRSGPIGVDIEALHTRSFSEVRRQKIEAIALDIAGGRPLPDESDRRFLQAWTRVEAFSKADGRGVLHTLSSAGGAAKDGAGRSLSALAVRDLEVGAGFCASVAGRALPVTLTVRTYVPGAIQAL
jgi:4'-phosphopantetheinyl transferase